MVENKIVSTRLDVKEFTRAFPRYHGNKVTPLLDDMICISSGYREFLVNLWNSELFKIFVQSSLKNNTFEKIKTLIKRDSLEFFKTTGKEIQPEEIIYFDKKILNKILGGLSQKINTCVILLGKPGVGKTTIVRALQLSLQRGKVPKQLSNHFTLELSAYDDGLVEKLYALSGENIVAFIDEAHGLKRDGLTLNERLRLIHPLKPLISDGKLKLILASTYNEAADFLQDGAFRRRVKIVRVNEPASKEVIKIARQKYPKKSHKLLDRVYWLCDRWIKDEAFPSKMIMLLEMMPDIRNLSKEHEIKSVYNAVSERSGKPFDIISGEIVTYLKKLETFLKRKIIGQDQAIEKVVRLLLKHYLGIKAYPERPLSLLFFGPTGVGKTALSKAITEFLKGDSGNLFRLDMNEYSQQGDTWKLFGSSPGFVGSWEEPKISTIAREDPSPIILFDEIEKAHESMLSSILRLLDEGVISDNRGRELHFEDAIIVLTTNAGLSNEKKKIGFVADSEKNMGEMLMSFKPEFIGRVNLVLFKSLEFEDILKIVREKSSVIFEQLGWSMKVDEDFYSRVAARVVRMGMGARGVERILEDEVLR